MISPFTFATGRILKMKTLQSHFHSILALVLLLSFSSCSGNDERSQLIEMAQRSEQSYKLYRSGDYAAAKPAILDYIKYLEAKLTDPSFKPKETCKVDITLSYARLARLEERNNGPDKESYMQKAIATCQQLQVKRGCSPEHLAGQVDATDLILNAK